jgi:hypothetical protein
MGLPELMEKLLVESNPGSSEASRALESVKRDNSLLINELYEESGKIAKIEVTDKKNGITKLVDKTDARGVPVWERPNFKKAWDKLVEGNIIKPKYKSDTSSEGDTMLNKLYFFVQMKFTIAEYIWNLLAGFLVTSISYNYIINTGCSQSPVVMQEKYQKYQQEEAQRKQNTQNEQNKQPSYSQS